MLVSRRVKHEDNLLEPLFQCFSPLVEDECLVLSAEEQRHESEESTPLREMKEYSAADVARHNNPRDGIWITHNNKVYDVTDFVESHPGGDRIMMAAGRDLTVFWNAIVHSSDAHKMLESYRIGTLRKEDHVNHKEIVKPVKQQPSPENGFDAMLKFHEEASLRLKNHQNLLFQRDIPNALEELQLYYDALRQHAREEEQFLIPEYREKATYMPERERRNNADVYIVEHSRMKMFLARALNMLRQLKEKYDAEGKDSISTADIIKVMETEARLKELIRRHDGRESIDLYVGLENNTTTEQRRTIWNDIFKHRHEQKPLIDEVPVLAKDLVNVVAQNWASIKDRFVVVFERELKKDDKEKRTYLGKNPFSEPGRPGDLAYDWVEGVIEKAKKKQFDEIAKEDAKSWLRRRHGSVDNHAATQADAAEFIRTMLASIERSQESMPDSVRQAWSVIFGVYLSHGPMETSDDAVLEKPTQSEISSKLTSNLP